MHQLSDTQRESESEKADGETERIREDFRPEDGRKGNLMNNGHQAKAL